MCILFLYHLSPWEVIFHLFPKLPRNHMLCTLTIISTLQAVLLFFYLIYTLFDFNEVYFHSLPALYTITTHITSDILWQFWKQCSFMSYILISPLLLCLITYMILVFISQIRSKEDDLFLPLCRLFFPFRTLEFPCSQNKTIYMIFTCLW